MGLLDHAVLLVYLLAILVIAWRLRTRGGGNDDFFLAGRQMGWFPIGLSVMVTTFSAINYLAFPNEVFSYGLYVIAALPVFLLAAWPITHVWMPFFHDMQLTSAYAYLERRFDKRVRSLASGLFILWRLLWMATALYAASRIMAILTGLPATAIILLGGVVATAYTFLGGMRAVMWTDVLQCFVLFGGIAMGLHSALGEEGVSGMLRTAYDGGRLRPFVPFDPAFLSPDPRIRMTLWSGLIGVFVAFLSRYGADQVVMQRYFSARSLRMAKRGLWLNAAVSILALTLLACFGLAVYAHAVRTGSLPQGAWDTVSALQRKGIAMRQLAAMIRSFPPGITGLVVAGLLAATMSSIDSGINACSAAYVSDLHPHISRRKRGVPQDGLRLDRALTLGIGLVATLLALAWIPLSGRIGSLFMIVNKLINGVGSPLLALILLGMFSRRANAPGMFYGGIIGIVASITISLCVRPLALQYYAALNLLVSVAPCALLSLLASRCGYVPAAGSEQWTWAAWRQRQRSTT